MSPSNIRHEDRPRPPRLHIPIAVKREAARLQGGVCPCGCGTPCWGDAKETKALVEWDHDPALRRRTVNEAWTDYIPPQLDPRYIVGRCEASHDRKTRGSGATTAGTDAGYIKKDRKREKLLAGALSKPKKQIQGRGFQKGIKLTGQRFAKVKKPWPKRSFPKPG